ncbi:MAG: Fic family protein, partial [Sphingobacteriia bacterium]
MNPYVPMPLPPERLEWEALLDLLGAANRHIARYDGLLQSVVNPSLLLSPLRTQEAVLSSKIEGTQATLEQVMAYEGSPQQPEGPLADIQEVINYRNALTYARDQLTELPLSLRLIRDTHRILLQGTRGANSDPGNFRRTQNWIGVPGSTLDTARFVPPAVPAMQQGLNNWEQYLHYDEKDTLVQLAIVHAQFEILHPFIDGNGRIGRILIPLFLFHKGIIHQPVFYMSQYLEAQRAAYYDALKHVTDSGSWTHWIRFFLTGVIQQAETNTRQLRQIIDLYERMKQLIAQTTRSQWAIQCLDYLFSRPIFSSTHFHSNARVPKTSAARLLKAMEAQHIIHLVLAGIVAHIVFAVDEVAVRLSV